MTANLPFDLNVCLFIGILLNDRWGNTSLTRGSKLVKQVIIKQRVRILSIALCPVLSASVSGTVSLPSSPVGPSLTSLQLRKPVGQSRLPCLRSQSQCRGCCQGLTPSPERLAGGQMPQSASCFMLVPGDIPLACRSLAVGLWVGSLSLVLARPPLARDPRQGLPLRRLQHRRQSHAYCTVVLGVGQGAAPHTTRRH